MSSLASWFCLYRLLLFLYPGEFRRAYAEEMYLLFREMCLQEWQRRGWIGLLNFWLEAIFDLLWSVFLLHRERVAVSALASALATLVFGVALLVIEPRLSCASNQTQSGPVAFGIAVQGALVTFALGWMCGFCGFLFFPRTDRVAPVGLVEAVEGVAKS